MWLFQFVKVSEDHKWLHHLKFHNSAHTISEAMYHDNTCSFSEYSILVTVNSAVLLMNFFQYRTFSHDKAFSLNTLLCPIKRGSHLCYKCKGTHAWKFDLCSGHWLQRNFWKVLKTSDASLERSYLVQCSMSPLGPPSRQNTLAGYVCFG